METRNGEVIERRIKRARIEPVKSGYALGAQIMALERSVTHKRSGKQTLGTRWFITSLRVVEVGWERLAKRTRAHWVVENGGWLDAGQGAGAECHLTGDKFTALIRLRCPEAGFWATRGFFTKGGGHDRLVFNFFSHDFDQGAVGNACRL